MYNSKQISGTGTYLGGTIGTIAPPYHSRQKTDSKLIAQTHTHCRRLQQRHCGSRQKVAVIVNATDKLITLLMLMLSTVFTCVCYIKYLTTSLCQNKFPKRSKNNVEYLLSHCRNCQLLLITAQRLPEAHNKRKQLQCIMQLMV